MGKKVKLFFLLFLLINVNILVVGRNMYEPSLANQLYRAVYRGAIGYEIENVKLALEKGADPNYCKGECGWIDSNPLNVVSMSFYSSYLLKYWGDEFPTPEADLVVFKNLMEYGADISRRPYVWNRVYLFRETIDELKKQFSNMSLDIEPEKINDVINDYITDSNRLIEAFLEAGADPDMLGHPYPFSYEGMKEGMTDEKAESYFKKGTRAINVAIEKGILWESQVDLLLKYTTLDEESLKSAERSNDPLMVEKINKLWDEQNK